MTPFDPASGPIIALVLRLVTIGFTVLLWRKAAAARLVAFLGSAIASVVTLLTAAAVLRGGSPVHGVFFVHAASQLALSYTVDGLGAWFLVVLSIVAAPIAL